MRKFDITYLVAIGRQCSIYPQVATQNQFCMALMATPVKYVILNSVHVPI